MVDEQAKSLSGAVLEEVATQEGIDPIEFSDPLYDVIDPDALDALFTNGSGEVTFEYLTYRISVSSAGAVTIESL